MSITVQVAGETLTLHADRAVSWARARSLLVADPHFGKAAAFRAGGIPVPHGTTLAAVDRLDALLQRTQPARVIFLGDFLHAREGRSPGTLDRLHEFRARWAHTEMLLVRGNHDRRAGDPPTTLAIECVDAPLIEAPFAFLHEPAESPHGYALAGHIHPGARLYGPGGLRERLACFWFGARCGVLPAFGEFTGLAMVRAQPEDRVYCIAEGEVIAVDTVEE